MQESCYTGVIVTFCLLFSECYQLTIDVHFEQIASHMGVSHDS